MKLTRQQLLHPPRLQLDLPQQAVLLVVDEAGPAGISIEDATTLSGWGQDAVRAMSRLVLERLVGIDRSRLIITMDGHLHAARLAAQYRLQHGSEPASAAS